MISKIVLTYSYHIKQSSMLLCTLNWSLMYAFVLSIDLYLWIDFNYHMTSIYVNNVSCRSSFMYFTIFWTTICIYLFSLSSIIWSLAELRAWVQLTPLINPSLSLRPMQTTSGLRWRGSGSGSARAPAAQFSLCWLSTPVDVGKENGICGKNILPFDGIWWVYTTFHFP